MPWRNEMLMYCWPFKINLQGALSCKCKAPCVSAKRQKGIHLSKEDGRLCPGCLWQVFSDTLLLLTAAVVNRTLCKKSPPLFLRKPDVSLHLDWNSHYAVMISGCFSLTGCNFTIWETLDTEENLVIGSQHFDLVFIFCALGANPVKTSGSDIKDRPHS